MRGPWAVRELADLMWSSRQAPFLVTETNAGAIGFTAMNESPYDGQWRQIAWLLIARGARMVEYWQWATLHVGGEAFWGGIIPHSGIPGRAYAEIAQIGAEVARAGEWFRDATPDFDVALLWDSQSKFSLATQAPFASAGAWVEPESYRIIQSAFTRGAFDAKRQLRIVRPQQILPTRGGRLTPERAARAYPVLIAAGLYVASDDDLDFLAAYAQAGGHLVSGPRTGYADREARPRSGRQPGRLAEAAGAWFDETASLAAPVALSGVPGDATQMAELLHADGADVLARYAHPHYGRWAAVTTRDVGAGRITLIGCVPDQVAAAAIIASVCPTPARDIATPESVTVSSSTSADGATRIVALHNWSWSPAQVRVPATTTDLLSGADADEVLHLGAWDVRVVAIPVSGAAD